MNQFVADDEYGLGFHGQEDHQGNVLPDRQVIGDEYLPHAENQCRRPQKRPRPYRDVVPQKPAFRRFRRVHVASVQSEHLVERTSDTHEEKCRQQPPAAMDRGEEKQWENAQWQIVRKGDLDRRLDVLRAFSLVWVYATTYG